MRLIHFITSAVHRVDLTMEGIEPYHASLACNVDVSSFLLSSTVAPVDPAALFPFSWPRSFFSHQPPGDASMWNLRATFFLCSRHEFFMFSASQMPPLRCSFKSNKLSR